MLVAPRTSAVTSGVMVRGALACCLVTAAACGPTTTQPDGGEVVDAPARDAVGSGDAKGSGGVTGSGGSGDGGVHGSGGAGSGGAQGSGGAGSGGTGSGGAQGSGGSGTQPWKGVANSTCEELGILEASWYYNWTTTSGGCAAATTTAEFVPMISGKNEKTTATVASALTKLANAGYKTVLGFNEPNKTDQANMSVAQVVALWPQLTSNSGIRVGSPATSADGLAWFKDFMTQVNADTTGTLRVDFIAMHWYGWNAGSCDAKAATLENYLKQIEAIPGNRPIWITEWGCMNQSNPDPQTVQTFFSGAIAMLARHPRVERYAWYPWNTNNELFSDRTTKPPTLSPLGSTFTAVPAR